MKVPALYPGRVRHKRFRPKVHAFTYPVYYLAVDVDQLDGNNETQGPICLSFNRFSLFSLWRKDYGSGHSSRTLKDDIAQMLAAAGSCTAPVRITLFTMPKVLGYSFNPLSVYFCYASDGALCGVVYEVRNTFGQKHFYVSVAGALRHEARKAFFVSPFFPVAGHYAFRLTQRRDKFVLAIDYIGADGSRDLSATLCTSAISLTNASLLKLFVSYPFVTAKVTCAIHFEALRLWRKRLQIFRRPPHLNNVTHCRNQVLSRKSINGCITTPAPD